MATDRIDELPLVVVAGPTASGKTGLAVRLAEQFGGEIICADSRTIYRGMDVGTAKPTAEEQARVPHWGIDLVNPGEYFSVADFKAYTDEKIADIRARGKVPFLVGGTGLYTDAVVFDYSFGSGANPQLREELEGWSVTLLQKYCKENNILLPENDSNKRYLIRAIEQKSISTKGRERPSKNCIVVGIATDKSVLRTRIEHRAEQLFEDNVVEEAMELGKKYGWQSEAMTGNIYALVREFVEGRLDRAELLDRFIVSDWRLAKRQLTWLRSNPYLLWADLLSAEHYLSTRLIDIR